MGDGVVLVGRVAPGRVTMRMAHRAMAVWLTVCGAIARGRGSVVVARRAGARRAVGASINLPIVRALFTLVTGGGGQCTEYCMSVPYIPRLPVPSTD